MGSWGNKPDSEDVCVCVYIFIYIFYSVWCPVGAEGWNSWMSLQKDRQGMIEMHREICSCSMRRDGAAGAFTLRNVRGFPRAELGRFYSNPSWGSVAGWDILGDAQQRWWENAPLDIQPLLGGSWWKRLAARRVRQKEPSTTESFTTTKGVSGGGL